MVITQYEEFVKKYFPCSPFSTLNNLVYSRVIENDFVSEIFINFINKMYTNKEPKEFLILYKEQLARLLLYIPVGDNYSISFCFRSAIESLMKFGYSCIIQKDYDEVSKTSYRNIKEDLKKRVGI